MKRAWGALLAVLLLLPILALAHSGGTDKNGGHWNRSTGEYHYHHGYGAHQHTNGECPYDFDDKTGQRSKSSSKKAANSKAGSAMANYWWIPAAGAGAGGYLIARKRS